MPEARIQRPTPESLPVAERAPVIARGVCRLLVAAGYATLTEIRLPDGRRADVMAMGPDGSIHIVEIKSGVADFRADRKWPEYRDFCDALFFAIDLSTPAELIPAEAGLILADSYGAQIVRAGAEHRLTAARRKAVTLRFAKTAADRLLALQDPMARVRL